MIGAIMFVLLIGLMFIGIPIAFSMGLSAVIMLLINATATPVAIATKAVSSFNLLTRDTNHFGQNIQQSLIYHYSDLRVFNLFFKGLAYMLYTIVLM